MHAGLGVLRLAPPVFWAMTPRELIAALGTPERITAPPRTALADLMARFPDR